MPAPTLKYRLANVTDTPLLAALNFQLIRDEENRNPMTLPELEERMKDWIQHQYKAILFEMNREVVAYALYRRDQNSIYLRHFFVSREHRRQGIGREAMEILLHSIFPAGLRIAVEVLCHNEAARNFWKAMGFQDYAVTLELIRPETKSRQIL